MGKEGENVRLVSRGWLLLKYGTRPCLSEGCSQALDETFTKALAASYLGDASDDHHVTNQERAYGLLILNLDKNLIAPDDLDHGDPDKERSYVYR